MKNAIIKVKRVVVMMLATLALLAGFSSINADAATEIEAGKEYTGRLAGSDGRAEYTYTTTGEGYFYVELTCTDGDDTGLGLGKGSIIFSMEHNYKEYDKFDVYEGRGTGTSSCLSFKKGSKVKMSLRNDSMYCDGEYVLKVIQVTPKNFEVENNDSKKKANVIKLNTIKGGIVNYSEDKDCFVFKAPRKGKYVIKGVSIEGTEAMHVYKGYKEVSNCYLKSGQGWIKAYSGKLKKGQKIYIEIPGEYWYRGEYKLKITKR